MSSYNLAGIVDNIRKGSEIDISQFKDCLSSQSRLKGLKKKKANHSSTKNLLFGLVRLNKTKFLVCLLFFSMKVALTISGPFIINNIIHKMLNKQKQQLSFAIIVLLVILYKVAGSLINIVCDFVYSSLGFQYFAYLYWFILNNYDKLIGTFGKKINIIQYDCNIITNITYSSLTAFFYSIEIIVLYSMLIAYLKDSTPFSIFVLIVSLYLFGQAFASFVTYRSNSKYMKQKDTRINCNITVNDNEVMLKQREKQLFANKKFLFTKLLGKLISIIFPILINIYVFLIADRSSFSDQEYTVLVLINLIRSPISELMLAMNLNAEVLNSCKRIVTLSNYQDDFSRTKINDQLIQSEKIIVSNQNISPEKGKIALKIIFRYFFQTLPLVYFFGLAISSVLLTITKIYSFFITQHIIAGNCEYYHYIGLGAQIIAPLLFYLMLIFCSHKVSSSLFLRLKKQIDYQILNRISGDISAIDRTVTTNLFEIFSSFSFIIGSYIYSIISLGIFWLQCVLFLFLLVCLYIAVHYNRFIMNSRREVARKELRMKAQMVRSMMEGLKIKENRLLKKTWRQIFECKQMGLLIQNFYMAIVHLILLVLSLVLIIISQYLQLETLPQSILLMACLTIDSDISSLFFAAVRLQLSLVSYQRVLNTLSP